MDPNETLKLWREAGAEFEHHRSWTVREVQDRNETGAKVAREDMVDALQRQQEIANDLILWLDKGGFAPEWSVKS